MTAEKAAAAALFFDELAETIGSHRLDPQIVEWIGANGPFWVDGAR